jgi:hypothetical protein
MREHARIAALPSGSTACDQSLVSHRELDPLERFGVLRRGGERDGVEVRGVCTALEQPDRCVEVMIVLYVMSAGTGLIIAAFVIVGCYSELCSPRADRLSVYLSAPRVRYRQRAFPALRQIRRANVLERESGLASCSPRLRESDDDDQNQDQWPGHDEGHTNEDRDQ